MGKINLVLRKTFIKLAIAVLAFVPAVSFTACGNGKDKGTDKEEKPEYVYEADFKELGNMKMDSLSRSCFNDGQIYMTGAEIDYGKDYEINSLKNYLLQCTAESNNIDKTEISGLKKGEYINTLLLDDGKNLCLKADAQKAMKRLSDITDLYSKTMPHSTAFTGAAAPPWKRLPPPRPW